MEYLPSAFQIRYGGCKGMVAYDPTLDDSRKIIQVSLERCLFVCTTQYEWECQVKGGNFKFKGGILRAATGFTIYFVIG